MPEAYDLKMFVLVLLGTMDTKGKMVSMVMGLVLVSGMKGKMVAMVMGLVDSDMRDMKAELLVDDD